MQELVKYGKTYKNLMEDSEKDETFFVRALKHFYRRYRTSRVSGNGEKSYSEIKWRKRTINMQLSDSMHTVN